LIDIFVSSQQQQQRSNIVNITGRADIVNAKYSFLNHLLDSPEIMIAGRCLSFSHQNRSRASASILLSLLLLLAAGGILSMLLLHQLRRFSATSFRMILMRHISKRLLVSIVRWPPVCPSTNMANLFS